MRYSPLVLESRHSNKPNVRDKNRSPDRKDKDMRPSCLTVMHQSYYVRHSPRALEFS